MMRSRYVLCALLFAAGCRPASHGPADLTSAFREARKIVEGGVKEDGSWPTPFSPGLVYENLRWQKDVWAPSVMIMVFGTVAKDAGLEPCAYAIRTYLRAQIEPDGLVRYHGRNTRIIQDTDDTVLTWMAVEPDDTNLAYQVARSFRPFLNEDGLYRLWMNVEGLPGQPSEGLDPNPVDIGINIDIYLYLADHDPEGAAELCAAMRAHINELKYYPYGRLTPALYVLRELELPAAGCPLEIPYHLFSLEAPNMATYTDLTRMIRDVIQNPDPQPLEVKARQMLADLARNDFEMFRKTPLLMYHSDLTAQKPRYYWSTEMSAALWIRLYMEASRRFPGWPPPPPATSS